MKKLTFNELSTILRMEVIIDLFGKQQRWKIEERAGGFLVQIGFNIPCTTTGKVGWHWGGKQYVSLHACKGEIVNKAFGMFKSFVEHELREMFYYKGTQIYNPHLDVDKLQEFVDTEPFDNRT